MIQANYQTIFQIGLKSFPWSLLLHPIPFILIALLLVRFSGRMQFFKALGTIIALMGALFFIILVLKLVPEFMAQRREYLSGNSSVVEGTVQDFHPAPVLRAADESFEVAGVSLSYNIIDSTPCFHNTPPHKGPIREGLNVRIYYRDGCIQRVDLRQ
jgi:hypothetical protein